VKTWIHRLGSIRIAAVLLVVILIAMASGTIVEAARGSETAARTVYYATWFRILLGLFAANILFSLADLWPWGRQRIGFVLTHGSMLVILLGALITDRAKEEGRLALWEGEDGAVVETEPAQGSQAPGHFSLPFSVRLDSFEIDYYQGTRRPAMFRSRVTVSDRATGRTTPAVIEMNRELSYGGYRFFQSSYQESARGRQSVLLVSRDPGQSVVFVGYFLLMAGMGTVLATRVAQRRAMARLPVRAASARARHRHAAAAAIALFVVMAGAAPARADEAPATDPALLSTLSRLPVQHDGRVMPLDTMAREAVWNVTGHVGVDGMEPVDVVLGWSFSPSIWIDRPIVALPGELAAALGLSPETRRASFRDLARNQRLMALLQQAQSAEGQGRLVGGLLREALGLEERMTQMQDFFQGTALRVVPAARTSESWAPAPGLRGPADLAALIDRGPTAAIAASRHFRWELAYNAVRPSRLSFILLVVALAAVLGAWKTGRRVLDILAALAVVAGFGVMTWGLAARWVAAGRIPASNMYESLLFLGWGVGLFAVVALIFLRNRLVVGNATAMAALTMGLVDLLPIDPFIHPMPPVLSGTPWLAIHVPIIMISYSVLAIGVLVAHLQIGLVIFAPARRDLAFKMNDLLYWYIHIGSILLIAGILTGSIWAASSWGRYWGWDPKEVWSLVAFLAYLAILHGRFDRMIGAFGVAALSIVAFWTILMTYIGVNFVLTSGMHSYGFGGAGVVRSMLVVAALEGLFLFMGFMSQAASTGKLGRSGVPAPE
jgi:ABC-type transport system involved in cytochrome c biogenesis permease subunit